MALYRDLVVKAPEGSRPHGVTSTAPYCGGHRDHQPYLLLLSHGKLHVVLPERLVWVGGVPDLKF